MNLGSPVPVMDDRGSATPLTGVKWPGLVNRTAVETRQTAHEVREVTTPFGGAYPQLNAGLLQQANLERLI